MSLGTAAAPTESRCLLTGASGFIGGRLAVRLAAAGRPLRCLVRAGSDVGALRALGAELAQGDLTDPRSLASAAEGCDAIVHCAALVSDWATVQEIRAANVLGTRNLVRAARGAGVRSFVGLSTTDVYGHPGGSRAPASLGPPRFANWYAQTKLEAEVELAAAAGEQMRWTVLRPATVYGPGSVEVVGEIAKAIRGGHMLLIDGGRAVAGLCFVENLIDAIVLALEVPAEAIAGRALAITDGLEVTWERFTADLAAGLGCRPPRLSLPRGPASALAVSLECSYRLLRRASGLSIPPLLSRQAVQVLGRDQFFSPLAAERALGWSPRVGYEQGLAATLDWLRSEAHDMPGAPAA